MSLGQWLMGQRRTHWVIDGAPLCASVTLADGSNRLHKFTQPLTPVVEGEPNARKCKICSRLYVSPWPCPDCGALESRRHPGGACVSAAACALRQKRNAVRDARGAA